MNNEVHPEDDFQNGENRDKSREPPRIPPGQNGTADQGAANQHGDTPHDHKKPSVGIIFWHALWRKRLFWWHVRPATAPPNWAEKTSMYITAGILIAALIQALIYLKQAHLMERGLNQNILQLAIANRNANIAQDTLNEMKSSGTDTHDLAVAATEQADLNKHLAEDVDAARFQIDGVQGYGAGYSGIIFTNRGNVGSPQIDIAYKWERIEVATERVLSAGRTLPCHRSAVQPTKEPERIIQIECGFFIPQATKYDREIIAGEQAFRVKGTMNFDDGFGRNIPDTFCLESQPREPRRVNENAVANWAECQRAQARNLQVASQNK